MCQVKRLFGQPIIFVLHDITKMGNAKKCRNATHKVESRNRFEWWNLLLWKINLGNFKELFRLFAFATQICFNCQTNDKDAPKIPRKFANLSHLFFTWENRNWLCFPVGHIRRIFFWQSSWSFLLFCDADAKIFFFSRCMDASSDNFIAWDKISSIDFCRVHLET